MRTITFADAQAAIKAAIEVKGADYVYERIDIASLRTGDGDNNLGSGTKCTNYTIDPENGGRVPSCIVGHCYATWDVLDKVHDIQAVRGSVFDLRHDLQFTNKAEDYLDAIQKQQDEGVSWGEAAKSGFGYVEGPHAAITYRDDESKVW